VVVADDTIGRVGDAVVGRDVELSAVRRLLDGVDAGPASLALWGEAGIGKTTILEAGVAGARDHGFEVLVCRPAASEVRLSYAGLADLLVDAIGPRWDDLPLPQRRALDAALLRGGDDDPASDPRAVAAGFLSVLNGAASASPVMVAVDDLQWLDEPTRRVVGFALRRCRGPLVMLSTVRSDREPAAGDALCPAEPARLSRLQVSGLSLGALHHVLRRDSGRTFSRPEMLRIAALSGGNPFFAVEIARSLDVRGPGLVPFPSNLDGVVREHVGSLAPPVLEALLVASAVVERRLDLIGRACGGVDVVELLALAEDAGVVELSGGRVRFSHPLLAECVYAAASPGRRRALHRDLSDLVDDVEERARHLALGSAGCEADTVDALDAAAEHARRRGAPSAAAELLELAIGMGGESPWRRVQAARDHFDAGDPARARELLQAVIADLSPGRQRAEALGLLGTIVYETDDYRRSVEILESAFGEAAGDGRLRCSIALELCLALPNAGRSGPALRYVSIAVEEADRVGDGGLLAEALGCEVMIRFLVGQGIDEATLERALALEDPERRSHALLWPSLNAAMVRLWNREVDRARVGLDELYERCVERGAESDLWFILAHAAGASLWLGDVEAAERLADEMTERARMSGSEPVATLALAVHATVAAWRGRVGEARASAEQAAASLSRSRFGGGWLFALTAFGTLELSVGDHAAAARWLGPAAADLAARGFAEPSIAGFLPDAAEALIAVGRRGEAEPLVELLELSGRNPSRSWAEAAGARCRGLFLAADGQLDEAMAAFTRALHAHDKLPLRYDKARTLLALGQLQRRRNERRAAQTSLVEAGRLFGDVGAAQWAACAASELDRLGLRRGPVDQLTATEERIAALAGSGMTNREVAARLFLSPKTIEANLARVYRKLGIRTRAELGRYIAGRSTH
jgi:DNA-binding CsgD family transcriptional regulator